LLSLLLLLPLLLLLLEPLGPDDDSVENILE